MKGGSPALPALPEWLGSARAPAAAALVFAVYRIAVACRAAVETDEPQRRHIVYRWLAGAIPYRDVSDNHTPLFHALLLPLAALVGQSPDVVFVFRAWLLPAGFGVLAVFWVLAQRLTGAWAAGWSVAVLREGDVVGRRFPGHRFLRFTGHRVHPVAEKVNAPAGGCIDRPHRRGDRGHAVERESFPAGCGGMRGRLGVRWAGSSLRRGKRPVAGRNRVPQ